MQNQVLLKPIWSNEDIEAYVGCKSTRASQIHRAALNYGGLFRFIPTLVYRDAVLKALNIDLKAELETYTTTLELLKKEQELAQLSDPYVEIERLNKRIKELESQLKGVK